MAKFTGDGAFNVTGNGARLYDCRFENTAGVAIFNSDVIVEGCYFVGDGAATGLDLSGTATVRDCYFTNWDYGIETNDRTVVEACRFDGGEQAGIYSGDTLIASGNWFDAMPVGIGGFLDEFSTISGNVFENSTGIYADQGAEYCVISDNTVSVSETGILIESALEVTISDNFVNASQDGIVIDGSGMADSADSCSIQGNTVYEPGSAADDTYDGIRVVSGIRVMVSDNTIVPSGQANDTRYGVNIVNGECNMVVGNDLSDTNDYGSDALNDAGANTQLFWPNDATYGDNFVDCGTGS